MHRTVSTNVLGSRNVLAAAAAAGVPQVVCASTGKALRPYSPEMYTASKRAAEWTASVAAASGELLVSAARFTHVLDNSIVYGRLLDWAAADGGRGGVDPSTGEAAVVRLHGSSIAFYVQSALESAQLLLIAYIGARPRRVPGARHHRPRLAGEPDRRRARRAGVQAVADAGLHQRL